MTKSFPLLLSAALLLTACGKAPATAPVAQVLAARAAAQATTPTFGSHLVVKTATATVEGNQGERQQEVFCVEGTVDGKPFSFSASSFFPYYIPMFGTATIDGKDQKLTPAMAAAVEKLFKAATASAKQKEAMTNLLYGLHFIARRDAEQPAN